MKFINNKFIKYSLVLVLTTTIILTITVDCKFGLSEEFILGNYNSRVNIINSINGTVAGSSLILGTGNILSYLGSSTPMITGSLNSSTNLNTWYYGNSNQNIKGGTYRNLILNGGGVKTLQGNVSVLNTYTLTAPATKNDNGYTFGNP